MLTVFSSVSICFSVKNFGKAEILEGASSACRLFKTLFTQCHFYCANKRTKCNNTKRPKYQAFYLFFLKYAFDFIHNSSPLFFLLCCFIISPKNTCFIRRKTNSLDKCIFLCYTYFVIICHILGGT